MCRQLRPSSRHRPTARRCFARPIVIVIAWRSRPAAAVFGARGSGLRAQGPSTCWGTARTANCSFRRAASSQRSYHSHSSVSEPVYYSLATCTALAPAVALVTKATPSSFCHCSALVWSRPATQPPAHRALALAPIPRYVALHHVESHTRPHTLSLATTDHSLLPFPFPFPITLAASRPGCCSCSCSWR